MSALDGRSTGDVVVLLLTLLVGTTVLVISVGVIVLAITRPEIDTSASSALLRDVVTGLFGAIVGYLAGKRSTSP